MMKRMHRVRVGKSRIGVSPIFNRRLPILESMDATSLEAQLLGWIRYPGVSSSIHLETYGD